MSFTRWFCALIMIAGAPLAADADDIATSIVAQAAAPAAITRCSVTNVSTYSFGSSFNVYDRSSHNLIDVAIEYRFFDRDNVQIGSTSYVYTPGETISAQDTGTFNNNFHSVSLAEPASAVSRVTCRLTQAHFTGRIGWKRGSTWLGGPLSAVPKTDSDSDNGTSAGTPVGAAVAARTGIDRAPTALKFDVQNAWNDPVQGGIFVHDALVVHGGDNPATIRPANFVLTMALANGGQKTYSGFARAAPSYRKYVAMTGQYTTAYEIDPKSDLGALGSLIVPAHTDINITLTFAIPDAIADATANRQVSFSR